jgi:hypothetical protein
LVGFGLPGTSAKSTVDLHGLEQPFAGGVRLVEGGVEQADSMRVGTYEADEGSIDRTESATGADPE